MELDEAKKILDICDRHELRDHAFGDMEVVWTKQGYEIAYGYLGVSKCGVHLVGDSGFEGEDALSLIGCGELTHVERNDSVGPDTFVLGRVMPGLTREAVKQELIMEKRRNRNDMNDYRR